MKTFEHSLGRIAATSIRKECTAKKLGNVHPQASFANMTYATFQDAAEAIGEGIDRHFLRSVQTSEARAETNALMERSDAQVGGLVLECVQSMLRRTGVNTSLGTILLFAPILEAAHTCRASPAGMRPLLLKEVLGTVLLQMGEVDSRLVYQAIASCSPGGLGESNEMSVHGEPPSRLLDAMKYASHLDDVALQYVTSFELVFELATRLEQSIVRPLDSDEAEALAYLQLELLAERPDSLIRRKAGDALAREVQERAQQLLMELTRKQASVGGGLAGITEQPGWQALDCWLREHRRGGRQLANPGTHADLLAAALLVFNLRQSDCILYKK